MRKQMFHLHIPAVETLAPADCVCDDPQRNDDECKGKHKAERVRHKRARSHSARRDDAQLRRRRRPPGSRPRKPRRRRLPRHRPRRRGDARAAGHGLADLCDGHARARRGIAQGGARPSARRHAADTRSRSPRAPASALAPACRIGQVCRRGSRLTEVPWGTPPRPRPIDAGCGSVRRRSCWA